ncbi:MAG TPA: DivIVA domain-containing protein [Actinomycetota bacterium]|jgi:cell division initiation protein
MSSDLDLPLLPSAEQIRRREFATVRRGYDPDQVREYLLHVSAQVATLEQELRDAKMRADTKASRDATTVDERGEDQAADHPSFVAAPEAVPGDEAYGRLAERFAEMIRNADEESTRVLEEARRESERILEEARTEADRVRVDAQARAEEARAEGDDELARAKEEADRILGGLADRRETLVTQMHEMQSKLLAVAKNLEIGIDEPDLDEAAAEDPAGGAGTAPDPVDPKYEDLWVSGDGSSVDIPDLEPLDLDFDEETPGTE